MVVAQISAVGDGILNVYKEAGWTSHDVVAKLRGLLKVRRIGHAGTLDPAATGVLPILVGRGTRVAEYLMAWDKEYRAVLRLGETTDTQDATGEVLDKRSTEAVTPQAIRAAVSKFSGPLRQVPPMFSAVKVGGVPLYRAARAGKTVERGPRDVTVHAIDVTSIAGRDVALRIVCSKGTYVRTLCADIGETLGVGGHLLALERARVGPLCVEDALTIERVQGTLASGELPHHLMSLDDALAGLPSLTLDEVTIARVLHGVPVPIATARREGGDLTGLAGQTVRLRARDGRLVALATVPASITDGEAGGDGQGEPAGPSLPILKVLAEQGADASSGRQAER